MLLYKGSTFSMSVYFPYEMVVKIDGESKVNLWMTHLSDVLVDQVLPLYEP